MKSIVGIVLLVALCIPIVAMLVDSPIGRMFGRRPARGPHPPAGADSEVVELQRRLELVEGDVEILQHALREVREHGEYLQEVVEQARRAEPPRGMS
ncbi:MAG: hypothetical protein ABIR59_06620 [Gemmatimonadales bacterium]